MLEMLKVNPFCQAARMIFVITGMLALMPTVSSADQELGTEQRAGSLTASSVGHPSLEVKTLPEVAYQTIDGFGASDAWRAQFVGKHWPIEKRNKVADLLFSQEDDEQGNPRGIGLSIWRFYLSAGTTEQGEASEIGNPWRRGECFLNADGTYVARIIHHDMVLIHAKSWQWWTAITQCDYKDGLVYLDDGSQGETGRMGSGVESLQRDGVVRDSKLLWVLGNYSRFIRPGMVRIKCELSEVQSVKDGLLVSAYKDVKKGQVVYVFTNLSEQDQQVNIGPDKQVKTYTTDENKNLGLSWQSLSSVNLPVRSVVTVVDK